MTTWTAYVRRHLEGQRTQTALADLIEVNAGTVSKWLNGKQGVDAATAMHFARKVGDSPLSALVASGHLTEDEVGATPASSPDYTKLSNRELLDLVQSRMTEDGEGNAKRAPSINKPRRRTVTDAETPGPRPAE